MNPSGYGKRLFRKKYKFTRFDKIKGLFLKRKKKYCREQSKSRLDYQVKHRTFAFVCPNLARVFNHLERFRCSIGCPFLSVYSVVVLWRLPKPLGLRGAFQGNLLCDQREAGQVVQSKDGVDATQNTVIISCYNTVGIIEPSIQLPDLSDLPLAHQKQQIIVHHRHCDEPKRTIFGNVKTLVGLQTTHPIPTKSYQQSFPYSRHLPIEQTRSLPISQSMRPPHTSHNLYPVPTTTAIVCPGFFCLELGRMPTFFVCPFFFLLCTMSYRNPLASAIFVSDFPITPPLFANPRQLFGRRVGITVSRSLDDIIRRLCPSCRRGPRFVLFIFFSMTFLYG